MTTQEAMHVAGNPDGVFSSDLFRLIEWIDSNPYHELFDSESDSQLMREYCSQKLKAMRSRSEGYIETALCHERSADKVYSRMPDKMKW